MKKLIDEIAERIYKSNNHDAAPWVFLVDNHLAEAENYRKQAREIIAMMPFGEVRELLVKLKQYTDRKDGNLYWLNDFRMTDMDNLINEALTLLPAKLDEPDKSVIDPKEVGIIVLDALCTLRERIDIEQDNSDSLFKCCAVIEDAAHKLKPPLTGCIMEIFDTGGDE